MCNARAGQKYCSGACRQAGFRAARVAEGVTRPRDGSPPSRVVREIRRERLIVVWRRRWVNVFRHGGQRARHHRPVSELVLCGIDDGHCYAAPLDVPATASAAEMRESMVPERVKRHRVFARAGEILRQGDVHLVAGALVERVMAADLGISRPEIRIKLRNGRGLGGHTLPASHRLLDTSTGRWLVHNQHPPLALAPGDWFCFRRPGLGGAFGVGCGD